MFKRIVLLMQAVKVIYNFKVNYICDMIFEIDYAM